VNVFVSCTTRGLGPFRDVVCNSPQDWWGDADAPRFLSMADAKAAPIPPVDWSIREAAAADLLVLLLGRHHGELAGEPDPTHSRVSPEDLRGLLKDLPAWQKVSRPEQFSFTQWEVLAARQRGVPILVFAPDRDSTDEDLRAYREMADADPEWAQLRQECFAAWVRSWTTEDHFRSRADLLNKVRKAVKRQRRGRRLRRVGGLVAAGLVVVGLLLSALLLYHRHREARQEQDRQAARQREQEEQRALQEGRARRLRNSAVAVGAAVAMVGQSSQGAGQPLFERSLETLGFPPNQVREFCQEYVTLEQAVRSGRLDYDSFQTRRQKLLGTIKGRLRVLSGDRYVAYVGFGHDLFSLLLLCSYWDQLGRRGDVRTAAGERLNSVQEAAAEMPLPPALTARLRALEDSAMARPAEREAAFQTLKETLSYFDMEPDGSNRLPERKPW
jgi:hypothetical protein